MKMTKDGFYWAILNKRDFPKSEPYVVQRRGRWIFPGKHGRVMTAEQFEEIADILEEPLTPPGVTKGGA